MSVGNGDSFDDVAANDSTLAPARRSHLLSGWNIMRLTHLAVLRSGDSITSELIDPVGRYPVYGGNGIRGYTASFNHDGDYVLIGRQGIVSL